MIATTIATPSKKSARRATLDGDGDQFPFIVAKPLIHAKGRYLKQRLPGDRLDTWSSAAKQRKYQKHQEDEKEYLCNGSGHACEGIKAQCASDDRYHQEDQGVVKHRTFSGL